MNLACPTEKNVSEVTLSPSLSYKLQFSPEKKERSLGKVKVENFCLLLIVGLFLPPTPKTAPPKEAVSASSEAARPALRPHGKEKRREREAPPPLSGCVQQPPPANKHAVL